MANWALLKNGLLGFAVIALAAFSGCGANQNLSQPASLNHADKSITLEFWTLQLATFDHVIEPLIASV
jgi:hypothetical protein